MRTGRKLPAPPRVECLEERALMAAHLTASLSGGLLRIEGTNNGDRIVVRQDGGRVTVDGARVRVGGHLRDSVSASAVSKVEVSGLGGNDTVDLRGTARGGDPLRAAATVWGGSGNDTVWGSAGNDRLFGGDGNDTLRAGRGNDLLDGGAGNDTLIAGAGKDVLLGGAGKDVLRGGSGNDVLDGGAGNDVLWGGAAGNRMLGGAGNDVLYGGRGNGFLDGGAGNDVIFGGRGNDILVGGAGSDAVYGGQGNDRLMGGDGNDVLHGGPGNDTLDGGAGRNVLDGGPGRDVLTSRSAADRVLAGSGDRVTRTYRLPGVHPGAVQVNAVSGLSVGTPQPGAAASPSFWQAQIDRLLSHINAYRVAHHLPPVAVNPHLVAAARYQAGYMARTGYYDHVNLDGRGLPDRVEAAGYSYRWVGENIHLYDPSIARTLGIDRTYAPSQLAEYFFDGWRVSPDHNEILLSPNARQVGVAIVGSPEGLVYAAADFGLPR